MSAASTPALATHPADISTGAGVDDPASTRLHKATAFLRNAKVQPAPTKNKVAFLKQQGLSDDEVLVAFSQVHPDSSNDVQQALKGVDVGTVSTGTSSPPLHHHATAAPSSYAGPVQSMVGPDGRVYYQNQAPQYSSAMQVTYPTPWGSIAILGSALLALGGSIGFLMNQFIQRRHDAEEEKRAIAKQEQDAVLASLQKTRELCTEMGSIVEKQSQSIQKSLDSIAASLSILVEKRERTSSPPRIPSQKAELSESIKDLLHRHSGSSKPSSIASSPEKSPVMIEELPEAAAEPSISADDAMRAFSSSVDAQPELKTRAAKMLTVIVNNIRRNPTAVQYQRISMNSVSYQNNIAQVPAAKMLFRAAGFVCHGDYWIWDAPAVVGSPAHSAKISQLDALSECLRVYNISASRSEENLKAQSSEDDRLSPANVEGSPDADENATPYSPGFAEIMSMVARGETPPNIRDDIDDSPSEAPLPKSTSKAPAKPWADSDARETDRETATIAADGS